MFIPINTDAPLYHRPLATCGLMIANIVTFFITRGGAAAEGWLLTFGNGLHPSEWIASAFLHFGFLHLLGNLLFLWAYGLIIEGKIGSLKFLGGYLLLAAVDGCLIQILMLGRDPVGGAGGASGVIFALMAIALVWAPENEFEVVWVYSAMGSYMRAGTAELSVLFLSGLYLFINFTYALFYAFEMSTPVLHLLGAVIGLPVGILLLKQGWVDCEGWDLFSVMNGKHLHRGPAPWQHRQHEDGLRATDRQAGRTQRRNRNVERKIESNIAAGKAAQAIKLYRENRQRIQRRNRLTASTLKRLVDQLTRQRQWQDAALVLEDTLPLLDPGEVRPRLLLAKIYVDQLCRPRAAQRLLDGLPQDELPPQEQRLFCQIFRQAQQMLDDGVVEIQA